MTPTNNNEKTKLKDAKNFKFLGRVGKGLYGSVYRALHLESNKLYAIKLVDKRYVHKVIIFYILTSESNR